MRRTGSLKRIADLPFVLRVATILALCLPGLLPAQESEWKKLNQETMTLYRQGNYTQAVVIGRQALAVAEKTFGPEHPDVALSLNNLGALYEAQSQYGQAETLYIRSLAINEKLHGQNHSDVARSLNNLAVLYDAQGHYAKAEPLYLRSLAIKEKILGPDHPDVALSLNNLAGLYETQGQYGKTEPLHKRALTIREKTLGPNHPDVAQSLNGLGALYKSQGHYALAEPLYTRALAINEKALGPNHPDVAQNLDVLAALYSAQGHYAKTEAIHRRSLAIKETIYGPNHPEVAIGLSNLAAGFQMQGSYTQAEPLYRRALDIDEKALGPDHPDLARDLVSLAALHYLQGRYIEAEPLYKRALSIQEKALGLNHPDVAAVLNDLAELYRRTGGERGRAEQLYLRALTIREKALGPDHADVARTLNNLGALYLAEGKYTQAESLYQRSLVAMEKALGPEHSHLATVLGRLADLYRVQGKYAPAEAHNKRALTILEKALGPQHPQVATTLHNFAGLYQRQGKYAEAEPLYRRAISIDEMTLGADHPNLAISLNLLASLHVARQDHASALPLARRASGIYRQRIVAGGTNETAIREASQNRPGFLSHLMLLSLNPGKEAAKKLTDEAFQIVQLEQASGTAAAIARMASRFASGDDALAKLVKRKQDAIDRRTKDESDLIAAASKKPQDRKVADEQRLRDGITRTKEEIDAVDVALNRQFPEYQKLTRPEPLTIKQVQELLRPEEALLVYALGENQHSFIWVVRQEGAVFLHSPVDAKALAATVTKIRAEMEFSPAGKPPPVSLGALHEIYRELFAPALPQLAGVKHIMVVPSRALQSLPFGMLVGSPPPAIASSADYRKVDWLARHYALSVLPAVGSLQALRRFAKPGTAQKPFAGFGDPLIGETSTAVRGKRAKLDPASVFRGLKPVAGIGVAAAKPALAIADVEAIRAAPRLPETADELRAMATAAKADQKSLWLQENATETRIKKLALSQYRMLAFATHGVMAGEIEGIGEPGLILTPPQHGSPEDDGYLSAGEIARLGLNADWVFLSACNTAAADGTTGAEGLSGLAKAFFYAGARSLLVSHWPVASEATVPLTTGMLNEYAANPGLGKAEAHRKAMLALIDTPAHPEYAHPLYWAPFVVVGEGGASGPGKGGTTDRNRR